MANVTIKGLSAAMTKAGIDPVAQAKILDDFRKMRGDRASTGQLYTDEWRALIRELQKDKRVMQTNLHNRNDTLQLVHKEYIDLLTKIRTRIERAAAKGVSIAEFTKATAQENERRAAAGLPLLGDHTGHWQSWATPAERLDMQSKVTQAYAQLKNVKGSKFVPFVPTRTLRQARQTEKNLRGTFARMRATLETAPKSGMGATPYRALQLAAVRMAEISLGKLLKSYELGSANPADTPVPVNWYALLDAPMRRRLKDAQTNPAGVTLDGLDQFYDPAPAHVQEDFNEWDTHTGESFADAEE